MLARWSNGARFPTTQLAALMPGDAPGNDLSLAGYDTKVCSLGPGTLQGADKVRKFRELAMLKAVVYLSAA